MKNSTFSFFILLLLFSFPIFGQENNQAMTISGKVVSIESGNLLTIRDNKNKYLVKIAGIKAPKYLFRKESLESLSKLVKDKNITLNVLSKEKNEENKEIIIAEAMSEGKDIALEQISRGMVWSLSELKEDRKSLYKEAEKSAPKNKLGLWGVKFLPCKILNQESSKETPQERKGNRPETAGMSGSVDVEVVISEKGDVISAKPLCGHPVLQTASAEAALQSKFSPTILSGVPVKVTGTTVYNFMPKEQ